MLVVLAGVDVQEVKHEDEKEAAAEHGNGAEDPQVEREGEVEGSEAERPEVSSPVHRRGHVLHRQLRPFRPLPLRRHVDQHAGVAVVPDRLQVEQKRQEEAHQDRKEFHRPAHLARVPHHHDLHLLPPPTAGHGRHQHCDQRAERDGHRR